MDGGMRVLEFLLLGPLAFGPFLSPADGQWVSYPTVGVPLSSDGKPNLSAPAPRTVDGKPDLSGLWEMKGREGETMLLGQLPGPQESTNIAWSLKQGLPYQPEAAELMKTRRAEQRVNDPLTHCLPIGPVRLHTFNSPKKIIQTPGLVILLSEFNASYRQIFTDGRSLPVDPNPSWNGYSSGHWEGDTLVVDTKGFRDGLWLDNAGNPLTDAARITERFRRVTFGQLEIDLTVNDPKAYTKPWTVTLRQTITLNTDLLDFNCLENEKDVKHFVAK
jgi:hypothetical protein